MPAPRKPVKTIAEVADEIAAGWPPLTDEQIEEMRPIFAPFVKAASPRRRTTRRAA